MGLPKITYIRTQVQSIAFYVRVLCVDLHTNIRARSSRKTRCQFQNGVRVGRSKRNKN